jgi:DNA-binding IclR family transcriptional regulator
MLEANVVRSVDRAVGLLVALGQAKGDVGVTELARCLGLHKSTASRLLATLHTSGLVEQDDDSGKYRLGLRMVWLGGQAEKVLDISRIALPEMEDLARGVHEIASLVVLQGGSGLLLASCDALSGHGRSGRHLPLHATASGKVLLAYQPEREVIRLCRIGLVPYTSHTIVRVDALLEELARVRKRRFATALGEQDPALNAVAVPVFDQRSFPVAALELSASGNWLANNRLPELVDRARNAAAIVTEKIGGATPLSAGPAMAFDDQRPWGVQ